MSLSLASSYSVHNRYLLHDRQISDYVIAPPRSKGRFHYRPRDDSSRTRRPQGCAGNKIRTLEVFDAEWRNSFQFTFVRVDKLTLQERRIFEQYKTIASLIGGLPKSVKGVLIPETMRPAIFEGRDLQAFGKRRPAV